MSTFADEFWFPFSIRHNSQQLYFGFALTCLRILRLIVGVSLLSFSSQIYLEGSVSLLDTSLLKYLVQFLHLSLKDVSPKPKKNFASLSLLFVTFASNIMLGYSLSLLGHLLFKGQFYLFRQLQPNFSIRGFKTFWLLRLLWCYDCCNISCTAVMHSY